MDPKVIPLNSGRAPVERDGPVQSVVDLLEQMLADARTGQIRAVVICGIGRDRDYYRNYAGDCWSLEIVGTVACLLAEVTKKVNEEGST